MANGANEVEALKDAIAVAETLLKRTRDAGQQMVLLNAIKSMALELVKKEAA